MQNASPEISELKQRIEESVGRKMKTSTDFTFLSGAIWERTHENLSASTLKRLWGSVDGPDKTRNSTLDILSKFLGFKDWDGFLEHIGQDNGSDRVKKQHIKTDDLVVVNYRRQYPMNQVSARGLCRYTCSSTAGSDQRDSYSTCEVQVP